MKVEPGKSAILSDCLRLSFPPLTGLFFPGPALNPELFPLSAARIHKPGSGPSICANSYWHLSHWGTISSLWLGSLKDQCLPQTDPNRNLLVTSFLGRRGEEGREHTRITCCADNCSTLLFVTASLSLCLVYKLNLIAGTYVLGGRSVCGV